MQKQRLEAVLRKMLRKHNQSKNSKFGACISSIFTSSNNSEVFFVRSNSPRRRLLVNKTTNITFFFKKSGPRELHILWKQMNICPNTWYIIKFYSIWHANDKYMFHVGCKLFPYHALKDKSLLSWFRAKNWSSKWRPLWKYRWYLRKIN